MRFGRVACCQRRCQVGHSAGVDEAALERAIEDVESQLRQTTL